MAERCVPRIGGHQAIGFDLSRSPLCAMDDPDASRRGSMTWWKGGRGADGFGPTRACVSVNWAFSMAGILSSIAAIDILLCFKQLRTSYIAKKTHGLFSLFFCDHRYTQPHDLDIRNLLVRCATIAHMLCLPSQPSTWTGSLSCLARRASLEKKSLPRLAPDSAKNDDPPMPSSRGTPPMPSHKPPGKHLLHTALRVSYHCTRK